MTISININPNEKIQIPIFFYLIRSIILLFIEEVILVAYLYNFAYPGIRIIVPIIPIVINAWTFFKRIRKLPRQLIGVMECTFSSNHIIIKWNGISTHAYTKQISRIKESSKWFFVCSNTYATLIPKKGLTKEQIIEIRNILEIKKTDRFLFNTWFLLPCLGFIDRYEGKSNIPETVNKKSEETELTLSTSIDEKAYQRLLYLSKIRRMSWVLLIGVILFVIVQLLLPHSNGSDGYAELLETASFLIIVLLIILRIRMARIIYRTRKIKLKEKKIIYKFTPTGIFINWNGEISSLQWCKIKKIAITNMWVFIYTDNYVVAITQNGLSLEQIHEIRIRLYSMLRNRLSMKRKQTILIKEPIRLSFISQNKEETVEPVHIEHKNTDI